MRTLALELIRSACAEFHMFAIEGIAMDDCSIVVRAWYEQNLAGWREAGIVASIPIAWQEAGLEKIVVEFDAGDVVASVTTWSTGTVESIVFDARVDKDPHVLNEEFKSHSELRNFLDRSSASLTSVVQKRTGAT